MLNWHRCSFTRNDLYWLYNETSLSFNTKEYNKFSIINAIKCGYSFGEESDTYWKDYMNLNSKTKQKNIFKK